MVYSLIRKLVIVLPHHRQIGEEALLRIAPPLLFNMMFYLILLGMNFVFNKTIEVDENIWLDLLPALTFPVLAVVFLAEIFPDEGVRKEFRWLKNTLLKRCGL
jgi:hypothetical protein